MKAIILAAGQGTRLKKYTENLPKGMLAFGGKTIIERQIELYRRCGVENIIVVTGFAADKINYADVKYYKNEDCAITNMVESLMLAKAEFEDDVILSYSDILFSEAMLQKMLTNADDFAVAVDKNWQFYWQKRYGRIDFDTESLSINGDGCITSLGLENPPLSEIDARYIGLLKFSRAGLDKITDLWVRDYAEYLDKPWQQSGKHIRQAYMTDLLHALIKEVNVVKAVEFNNGWLEFDTNEDYENACQWVEDGSIKELIEL
jgi:choline kinase